MGFVRSAVMTSAALVMWALTPGVVAAQQAPQIVATGLDNPRGLAFGPDGALYVVEAGRGGTSPLCLPSPTGPEQRCYGATGSITRVIGTSAQRVLTGFPSLAVASGAEATGPHDIVFAFGAAWLTLGSGGDPALLAPLAAQNIRFGSIVRVGFDGQWAPVVDVAAFETANNPDGAQVDSNAFGFQITSSRGLIADAGANALLQVAFDGTLSSLATFPSREVVGPGGPVQMDSVPTTVAEAPDGSLYVGELTGFPFPVGGARIYRVPAAGGTPVMVADGFTNIIDIAIGPDGSAYVLEHDANGLLTPGGTGRLTKIGLFGSRTELAPGAITNPGGMTIGTDNAVYVTNNSSSAGTGTVIRIPQ